MNLLRNDRPALVLIDIQKGFDDIGYWGGERNNPNAEEVAGALLNIWRKYQLPIFHIRHCSANPDSRLAEGNPGNEFKAVAAPKDDEPVIKKSVNSAFIGTDLKKQLDDASITSLVIVGLTTDHCVSTTARMAGNYGYQTFVVSDATATFNKTGADGEKFPAEQIHQTALASLHKEFAEVVTAEEVMVSLR